MDRLMPQTAWVRTFAEHCDRLLSRRHLLINNYYSTGLVCKIKDFYSNKYCYFQHSVVPCLLINQSLDSRILVVSACRYLSPGRLHGLPRVKGSSGGLLPAPLH